MKRRVLFMLGLLMVAVIAANSPSAAQTNLKPVYLDNNTYEVLVKVVGPTKRTLKLGVGRKQLILLAPGNYRCLYGFYGGVESSQPETFMKTRDFKVSPSLIPSKPLTISIHSTENLKPDEEGNDPTTAATIRSVLSSSGQEFAAADRDRQPTPEPLTETSDRDLRFSEINIVATVAELYYAKTDAEIRRAEAAANRYLSQVVSAFIIPQLARQGFRVKYLVNRGEAPPLDRPTLMITYEETRGKGYSMSGFGEPDAHGVVITCSLSLDHPALAESLPIWTAELTGENPDEIKVNILASNAEAVLYQNALRDLRKEFSKLSIDVSDWALRSRATNRPAGSSPARKTRRRAPRSN